MQCIPASETSNLNPSDIKLYFADLQDNGLYRLECCNKHKTTVFLEQSLYEVLFDLGANAILDGYYREAVSSFTASMERFFEYYILIISELNKVPESIFSSAWKRVAVQSERQLGAYIFTYMMQNQLEPPLLHKKFVELRNEVTHRGKIPSKEDAIRYGQSVLEILLPVINELRNKFANEMNSVNDRYHQAARRSFNQIGSVMYFSYNTIIRNHETNLTSALNRIESQRKTIAESFLT